MVIAVLSEAETAGCLDCAADPDPYDASWPRPEPAVPALRLVPGEDGVGAGWAGEDGVGAGWAGEDGVGAGCVGVDVARRRARRAAVRRRRRAVALGALCAGLTCGLALPLSSLAGSAARAPARSQPAVAGETVYTVRPGDTLWSIAARFDHGGDPRAMAESLAAETGSAVVVPGERIPIP